MDVNLLTNLLKESKTAGETRPENFQQKPTSSSNLNIINNRGLVTGGLQPLQNIKDKDLKEKKEKKNEIWSEDEIKTEDYYYSLKDDRIEPKYEYFYKQILNTNDLYFNNDNITNSSQDSSHIIIKIYLPKIINRKEIFIDITSNRFYLDTNLYKLFVYLPCKVVETEGQAEFNSKNKILSVTLPIVNELYN